MRVKESQIMLLEIKSDLVELVIYWYALGLALLLY